MQQINTNLTSPSGAWGGLNGMLRQQKLPQAPKGDVKTQYIIKEKREKEKRMKSKCSKSILTSHPLQAST